MATIRFNEDSASARITRLRALAEDVKPKTTPRTAAEYEAELGPVWAEFASAQARLDAARHAAHERLSAKIHAHANALEGTKTNFNNNDDADRRRWAAIEL